MKIAYTGIVPMVARFIIQNWAHIRVFCEAAKLLDPKLQDLLKSKHLVGVHGVTFPDLACYALGSSKMGTTIEILGEGGGKACHYAISA